MRKLTPLAALVAGSVLSMPALAQDDLRIVEEPSI